MKIAFLNKHQNKVSRGAETFVAELGKRLSKNHEVDIISDINYFSLLKKKYDIIVPTNGRLQALIVRKIAWLTNAKVVISGQSGAGLDDRINLYTCPDTFVGLTNFQSDWAKRINPFIKVKTIPNGVDLSVFQQVTSKRGQTVLSVGAFTKEKRHDLTIKAVAELGGVKLTIVGSGGEEKENIKTLGERMLPGRFEIKSVSHDKMPGVYKESSLLAFPTVPWESFGIAIVEAMAVNIPVVATDDPIRREIVGDAGILIDPTDTEAYAKAIDEALKKNWDNKPRKQAEKFSWNKIAEQYEELFKTLLS